LGLGVTSNAELYFLTSTKYFQSAATQADGMLIPNLHKALFVVQKARFARLLYSALRLGKIPKNNPPFAPFFFGTSQSRCALVATLTNDTANLNRQ